MGRRAWFFYLAAGGGLTLAYLVGHLVPDLHVVNSGPVFNAIGASAAIAVVWGARLQRPSARLPWYLIALSQVLFVSGDVIAYNYERFFGSVLPFPSIADLAYLAVYPCLIAGILLLIGRRESGGDRSGLIDSLMITIGAGVISWVYLMAPYARQGDLSMPLKLISIAYPLMDVLVLGVVTRLAFGKGKRELAFHLLIAGALALLVTDSIYGWTLLHVPQGYATGGILDGGWALFYLLLGAAALHPSMRTLSEPGPEHQGGLSKKRLGLLTGATLMVPGIQAVQVLRHAPLEAPVTVSASAALFLLVVARMVGLTHKQEQRVLLEQTVRSAEEERTRIASELHDGPIQHLAALDYRLQAISNRLSSGNPEATESLRRVQEWLHQDISELRHTMTELRLPVVDRRGLGAALRAHADALTEGTPTTCMIDCRLDGDLDPTLQTVLYRVAQEALRNIMKHARASSATVALERKNGSVHLEVRDDGAGFDLAEARRMTQEGHFGLVGMRERVEMAGGMLELESSKGSGTRIRVVVPYRGR